MKNDITTRSKIRAFVAEKTETDEEFFHAINVSERFLHQSAEYYLTALLHDMIEDNYTTPEELVDRFLLSPEIIAALDAITRRPGERYSDYIDRVNQNPIARKVKIADIRDNIFRSMVDFLVTGDQQRWSLIRRYATAYRQLIFTIDKKKTKKDNE